MKDILKQLRGGSFRSIGISNEVVKIVLNNPKLLEDIIDGMTDSDPLVRMRSADVAEKVGKERPEYLRPFKSRLIREISGISQQEVRWHTAQMFSYLVLTPKERAIVANILFSWVESEKSNIVKVMSLQTLAGLARQDKSIAARVTAMLQKFAVDGSPSLKSRSKKLLKEY